VNSLTNAAAGALGAMLRSERARRAGQVLVTALVLFFFGYAAYKLWPDIASYKDWHFDLGYTALALAILIVRGPIGAYGWWLIMRQLGHKLPWWRSLRIVYYSSIAGYIPGGWWHAVSRVYLAEKEGAPRVITTLSVVIESLMVAFGAAVVSSISLLAWRDPPTWVVISGIVTLIVLVFLLLRPNALFKTANWLLVKTKRSPIDATFSTLDMLRVLWPYVLNWLLFGLTSFALIAAIYPNLSIAYLGPITGLFTAAWLAGYLAIFVPQGLVVRELIITSFLTGFVGLPVAVAAVAAVISRLWSMLGAAIWAAISTRL
jgi:glycosyltransferase 2 family protein